MKRVFVLGIVLAAAGTAGCTWIAMKLHHRNRNQPYEAEPFYRKYLVAGNKLDDQILEQERRVQDRPEDPDLRNDFGNLLAQRRFVEDARMQYEKALDLDDSHYLAAYNLGILWESEGKFSKAVSAYRQSISRKPGFPPSHFRLARLYEHRGWDGLAVKEYAKSFRLDPQMRDPRHNPLIVDTRLLERASLVNYERDISVAAMNTDQAFADEGRFREVPVDRPLSNSDIEDSPAPEPVDATVTAPVTPKAPVSLPVRPGQTRPQGGSGLPPGAPPVLPAGAPPPPTPVPTPIFH